MDDGEDHRADAAHRVERDARIGALTLGLAHNVNNMLAPILMAVDLLRQDETDRDRLELLASVEQSASRAAGVVRQVLEFARREESGARRVDLAELVREVIALMDATFPSRVSVELGDVDNNLVAVTDPCWVRDVLVDLCLDALDAMGERGGRLQLGAQNHGNEAVIVVQDLAPARPAPVSSVPNVVDGSLPELRASASADGTQVVELRFARRA